LTYNETLSLFENILAGAVGVSVDVQMKQHEMLQKNKSLELFALFREDEVFRKARAIYLNVS
jgi:hypothetical protein